MSSDEFDVIVIGGGPAGEVAAGRLAERGHRTATATRGRGHHRTVPDHRA